MPRGRPLGHSRLLDHRPSAARSWGAGVRVFFWGTGGQSCLPVSLFRENLCSPGVLPELLLLLGSLPRWGETGNSLRFRERYGQGGADGGERLPGGPPGEAGTARRSRGGTVGSRTPAAAIRARPPERPPPEGPVEPGGEERSWPPRALPAGDKAGPWALPSNARRPAGLGRWPRGGAHQPGSGYLGRRTHHRPWGRIALWLEFFRPQPRGRLGV